MAVNNRLVIYTCITNGYDALLPAAEFETGVDYVCFTDRMDIDSHGWQLAPVPNVTRDPAATNRYVKMHPHVLFPDRDRSVYVDGSIQPLRGISQLADIALAGAVVALYQHPLRSCIYEEGRECAALGYAWAWRISAQLGAYAREGYPPNNGLYEAGVLIRRHQSPQCIALMEAWWRAYLSGVRRDQLSLPYLAWKLSIPLRNLGPSDPRGEQRHFRLAFAHNKQRSMLIRLRGYLNRRFFLGETSTLLDAPAGPLPK